MPVNTTLINIGATAMAAAILYASTHTATPNSSGSNEGTADRVAVTASASGGIISASNLQFTGAEANEAIAAVGFWSASTGGTWYGYGLPGSGSDTEYNASGEATVTAVTITGTGTDA